MKYAMLLSLIGMISVWVVGCGGNIRPSDIVADYGIYCFTRGVDDKVYEVLNLDFENSDQPLPSIEIMLPDRKIFNCDSITVDSAKDFFPYQMEFDVPRIDRQLDKKIHVHKVFYGTDKDYSNVIVFCEGKLESVTLRPDGKFRFAEQKEFVSLPLSGGKMERLFGRPVRYKKLYPTHP